MKKFKTESKRMLDLVINSIYTHKEIFLRELLSNASDAIDKLYYKSLTGGVSGLNRDDFCIRIELDKDSRTLKISDNGIGMTEEELENNLGVIAKSGSFEFKNNEKPRNEDINIIGQFGVGFYSAFMVSRKVEVLSRAYGAEKAYLWVSSGAEGYDIKESEKASNGTEITLYLKDNKDEDNYDEYLNEYTIKNLVKKYSDYIRYPIKMEATKYREDEEKKEETYKEDETLNSMVPLWKKDKKDIAKEEYDKFYKDMFYDFDEPLRVIHTSAEGLISFKALLYIPARAPYNYYSKNYEKGLRLYTNGVLIMDKCEELLPDYFSFVKGVVDSELTLNISRETIQHNRQLKVIAANIENKIKNELVNMLKNDRETYNKFFDAFGLQLKFGMYDQWGAHKDAVQELVMFHSLKENKRITLEEYVSAMNPDQKYIYYATGKTIEAIKALPQCEKVSESGYDILCFTDDIDEFAIKTLGEYKEKEFKSIQSSDIEAEKENENTEEDKEILDFMKNALGDKVAKVKLSRSLRTHPVCITTEGEVTLEMEKVFKNMPNAPKDVALATKILEINASHRIYDTIKEWYKNDREKLTKLAKVLFSQALMIEGIMPENPAETTGLICELL